MCIPLLTALVVLVIPCSHADTNTSDYIFWQKAGLWLWDATGAGRALVEEWTVGQATAEAVASLSCGLSPALATVVSFQTQELMAAQTLMAGTDAQGCIDGIAHYMENAIEDEVSTYEDCTADALSKLDRLEKSWNLTKANYLATYQKVLKGIDSCAQTYPDKDSSDRLKSCIASIIRIYFLAANATQRALVPSPAMTYFQDTVVACASEAVLAVVEKGYHFLHMLLDCAAVSGSIDLDSYSKQLNEWKGYNNTLSNQITDAQAMNFNKSSAVQNYIQENYNFVKRIVEKYVVESRGYAFYLNRMFSSLSDYYNVVTQASVDYPAFPSCTSRAKEFLDAVSYAGAEKLLSCDLDIVNNTKSLVSSVLDRSLYLNNLLTSVGNAAILNCISQGYIFAPNTIMECFNLVYSQFDIELADTQASIEQNINNLSTFENFFSNASDVPCEGFSNKSVFLGGDLVLYSLERCLYISSGTVNLTTTSATNTTPTQGVVTTPLQTFQTSTRASPTTSSS